MLLYRDFVDSNKPVAIGHQVQNEQATFKKWLNKTALLVGGRYMFIHLKALPALVGNDSSMAISGIEAATIAPANIPR